MSTPHENAQRLAAESLAEGDSTGWFERLYAAAEAGETGVPWSREEPNPLLVEWAEERPAGDGSRRAAVVGCGLGSDAEYVGALGYDTVGFDISPSAVTAARRRFPESPVRYVVADLLRLPDEWRHAYHLVIESITVQSLPTSLRQDAIRSVASLVAPGGTLLVLSRTLE
ncbi:MAG: class I SAM-dependent methyltransferase, partial [Micromonosporaceae bacterium]